MCSMQYIKGQKYFCYVKAIFPVLHNAQEFMYY